MALGWGGGESSSKVADIYQFLLSTFLNEFIQLRDCFINGEAIVILVLSNLFGYFCQNSPNEMFINTLKRA